MNLIYWIVPDKAEVDTKNILRINIQSPGTEGLGRKTSKIETQ
jgi:hypothetical protein